MDGGKTNIDNVVPTASGASAAPEPQITTPLQDSMPEKSDRVLISWEAPSFHHQEKGVWWWVILGVVAMAVLGYFIWRMDWFSIAITIIVMAVLLWYVFTARPQDLSYSLTQFGLQLGDNFYPYSDVYSFWIVYTEKVKKVYFVFNKKYLPAVSVDITNIDPNKIRAVLAHRLPEQPDRGENPMDRILRVLKL